MLIRGRFIFEGLSRNNEGVCPLALDRHRLGAFAACGERTVTG